MIALLRSYFGIEPRDDGRMMREKVTGRLLSLERALEPALAVFLSLLDVPIEDPEWARLDPPQRRRQTLEALKRLLLRESQVQPVLLVVEDLHWIDAETQAWLDLLVESLPAARLLLLVNYGRSTNMAGAARRTTNRCGSTRCRRRAWGSCWRRCSGRTERSRNWGGA